MKFVLLLLFALGSSVGAQTLEIVTPDKKISLDLSQLKARLKSQSIKVQDPVFHVEKSYDAFLLSDVLGLDGENLKTGPGEIIFTSQDGYAPYTEVANLQKHRAFLAYQETGTDRHFSEIIHGKEKVSLGPFYVVWEGVADDKELPWPYQLVKIELVDFTKKFNRAFPAGAKSTSDAYHGFLVFKNSCIRCHSINLQGGDIGPELNYPMSVTEYQSIDHLKKFIRQVSKFRAKSKMPDFTELKKAQIDDVIAYLRFMSHHKQTN